MSGGEVKYGGGDDDVDEVAIERERKKNCVRNRWRETGTTGCVGIDRLIYG
jgi:hypothetical protein